MFYYIFQSLDKNLFFENFFKKQRYKQIKFQSGTKFISYLNLGPDTDPTNKERLCIMLNSVLCQPRYKSKSNNLEINLLKLSEYCKYEKTEFENYRFVPLTIKQEDMNVNIVPESVRYWVFHECIY